ncbi:MAG TPA: radical SAM protein, partial [Polyangiaceae bacterium]|nr:radical SAM protein [Polyangiaceae bacterium]
MRRESFRELAERRLAAERGRLDKQAPFTVALAYPSPYRVGMSSLGYLQIYKQIQAEPAMACERVFLPDDAGSVLFEDEPLSYESLRPLVDFPVIALSVAYELEMAGLVQLLHAASIPPLRTERDERHPLVVVGGPLTFSNPLPLAAFADAVIMGEADELALEALRALRDTWGQSPGDPAQRAEALHRLAAMP